MKLYYIMILAVMMMSCGGGDQKKDKDPGKQQTQAKGNTILFSPEQIKNGGVDTGRLPMHSMSGTIHVNGQVDVPPENLVSINVPMGGFLKRTTMLPGQSVRKGQVLAEVSNQEYITIQQDYLTSVSKVSYLRQEAERQRILSEQGASPVKLYQQAVADFKSEQAQAAGLSQKLGLLGINARNLTAANIRSVIEIRSPISGSVSQVNVNIGKYINPTDVLMELVNTSDIHAALTVFEQDIPKISIGNSVKLTLPNLTNKVYPGKVILIGRMLDTTHSVMVHCHFLKTDKTILPNMFLQATIESDPKKIPAMPDAAVVDFGGKKYIFMAERKAKGGVLFSMIPVSVGMQDNGWNEVKLIKPELKDKVFVLKGAFSILSAMKNTGDDGG
jgi:cobalt-zinc-cadmium efflux system membrane fusion protein